MGFVPRIEITVANNRCNCCEDSPVRAQPGEMAVFYSEKDKKFYAKLDRDDFSSLYKDLIDRTRGAIQEFRAREYGIVPMRFQTAIGLF